MSCKDCFKGIQASNFIGDDSIKVLEFGGLQQGFYCICNPVGPQYISVLNINNWKYNTYSCSPGIRSV
jgi:hypothetical protein